MSKDVPMAISPHKSQAKKKAKRQAEEDLFSQGWLDRHIDSVVAQIAQRPQALRPQLIGPRAEAMKGFYPDTVDF